MPTLKGFFTPARATLSVVMLAVVTAGAGLAAATPAQASTTTARTLLSRVSVAPESNSGYDRAKFGDWIDADRDCQNTRHEVLIVESRLRPIYSSSGCTVKSGWWVSPWDNRTWTNPLDVDIDHHVPLAEAWGSGARAWSKTDRVRYANDLYGPALNAMTDNLNSAKQAKDPAQWLPPYQASRCTYGIWWVQVKYRWRLSMDSAERTALSSLLSGSCGARAVTIPARAR